MPTLTIQTSGVTRAWCPARLRRSIAIQKMARHHNFFAYLTCLFYAIWYSIVWLSYKIVRVRPSAFMLIQGRYAPETPAPASSLIRVLETIDLSASNVEHFLDN